MPFGFKRSSVSGQADVYPDEKKSPLPLTPPQESNGNAPPTYEATDPLPPATIEQLNAAFSTLNISPTPKQFPDADLCMAHLKLLEAFFTLKEETGYTDGLFDLWDSRAPGTEESVAGDDGATRARMEALSKIREKRWALYVARAVDRFEAWWIKDLFVREATTKLTMNDMCTPKVPDFPRAGKPQIWTQDMLPPLDVLMVWHSFMLNPRNYLEDCMRWGLKDTWATGMPWQAVNAAIDPHFNYIVSQEAKDNFTNLTGRKWDNTEDSSTKDIPCPRCQTKMQIPWTTCGLKEDDTSNLRPGLVGTGYGERELSFYCDRCGGEVTHDVLRVGKFKRDMESLLLRQEPMGGTILFGTKGVPTAIRAQEYDSHAGSFPNRLLSRALRSQVLGLCAPDRPVSATMTDVRDLIEGAIQSSTLIRAVNKKPAIGKGGMLTRQERLSIRQMMSRYWESHTIFSMELGGAVIRQSTFVDKMHGLDWLHSPTVSNTMARLLVKYGRFMSILGSNPFNTAVPTLDVDLAWHTHQLSPQQYYAYTLSKTYDNFVDHDDKIDEGKLSDAFEWTSKVYEKEYGEVYSECSCWYCEAIRAKHVSTAGKLLRVDKHEKINDTFYSSGQAKFCPADKSAHISSHNAVPAEHQASSKEAYDRIMASKQLQLDEAYQRACKRAIKKGRPPPRKERYREEHWGYGYYGYYPYMGPYMFMSPMFYPYAFYMPMGVGMYGACAAGTCGGGVAAGGCSGGGGCGEAAVVVGRLWSCRRWLRSRWWRMWWRRRRCGGGGGGGGCGGGGGGG